MQLVIDFETVDPYIQLGYGAGWTFALKGYKNPEFKLLGASVKLVDSEDSAKYYTDLFTLAHLIKRADSVIMHNAQYDIGCILVLFNQLGIAYKDWLNTVTFYDTMLMAKLANQQRMSYSLESLSKEYGGATKDKAILADYMWNSGLYQKWHRDTYNQNSHKRPDDKRLFKVSISMLDKIPEDIVGAYCNADVNATYDLYDKLSHEIGNHFPSQFKWARYSDLLKICVNSKINGVRVDLEKAKETQIKLNALSKENEQEAHRLIGYEFNLNSSIQVVEALKSVGVNNFPKTDKGADSVRKDWLEQQGHPVCKHIVRSKNYAKLARDFLGKLISYQQIHIDNGSDDYRIFPSFNIFGATATGRFSSGGAGGKKANYELNMQQIPKRGEDDEAAKYVRGVFLPEKGEQWISADFSNQEQRLQVEFAYRFGIDSVNELLLKLQKNPRSDFHFEVAGICSIHRTEAKTINLGLCLDGNTSIETLSGETSLKNIEIGDYVFTRQGRYCKVLNKTKRIAEAYKIATNTGKYLVGSKEHHVLVTKPQVNNTKREYIYLPIADLKIGMYLTPNILERKCGDEDIIGLTEAHALGFWIAEGHYNRHDYQMQACQNDGEYLNYIKPYFNKVGIRTLNPDKTKRCLLRYPKTLRDKYINILNLDLNKKAKEKYIPRKNYSKNEIRHILCGLFEGDGCISGTGNKINISYTTISEQLAKDVVYYLQKLGISSKIYKNKRYKTDGIIVISVIGNISKRLFMKRIPTFKNKEITGKIITTIERIIDIKKVSKRDLYDIEVEKDNNFTANGLVVHNSYGMGEAKLCRSLNLPTTYKILRNGKRIEIAGMKARGILDKYHTFLPFMKELQVYTANRLQRHKYIDTIAGRRLQADKPVFYKGEWIDFNYKGLSKLIQGSAADITIEALINCYKVGLKILISIHDEICISSKDVDKDSATLEKCMTNTFPMAVPMVVDIVRGETWAG